MTDRAVYVHWRSNGAFCASLQRGLERAGLSIDRSVARGVSGQLSEGYEPPKSGLLARVFTKAPGG